MAAGTDSFASRVLAALSWAAAAYLVGLLAGYYLDFWDVRRHHLESAAFVFVATLLSAVFLRRVDDGVAREHVRPLPAVLVMPALLAITAAQYVFLVPSGLFADDYVLLEAAREGRLTVWSELFRPAVFVLWRAVASLTDHVAPALHLLNIGLHGLNGYLVCALAYGVGVSRWTGAGAGVLFVWFPGAVEAVAWPSGIQDVLMTTLVLGFLILVVRPLVTRTAAVVAVALLTLALLTKETAVAAPALAGVLCAALGRPRGNWMAVGAAALTVAMYLSIRFLFLPLPDDYALPSGRYAIKELLVRPFATLVVPVRAPLTGDPAGVGALVRLLALALSALVVVTMSAAASRWDRTSRWFHLALAAAAFVLIAVAPLHSYFHVTSSMHGSRYLYLPAAAWCILLAVILRDAFPRPRSAGAMLVVFVAYAWSTCTGVQRTAWQDAATLRDRILGAAARTPLAACPRWSVTGLPDLANGVPVFINGFPEAMRAAGRQETFSVRETTGAGTCELRWTGSQFASDASR